MAAPPQYSAGPYSAFASLPAPPRPVIHSSRSITADTAEYELDPVTGGNLPMSSTAQRVLIVVTKAQHDQRGGFITDPDRNKTRRAIRAALEPLIKDGSITVRDDAVELVNPSQGVEQGVVNYKSIKQGIDQSVQLD